MNAKADELKEERIADICEVYHRIPRMEDEIAWSVDEMTGIQALEIIAEDLLMLAGKPIAREFEYNRNRTQTLIAGRQFATGTIHADCGDTGWSSKTAWSTISRVNHSGGPESFKHRLCAHFLEVHRKLDTVGELIPILGSIDFDPTKLANDRWALDHIFEIIPASKRRIIDGYGIRLKCPKDSSDPDRCPIRIQYNAEIIESIPSFFAGEDSRRIFDSGWRNRATMFDFLNVFTEYAKACAPRQKLAIEEKTGELAKYLADNAGKFRNSRSGALEKPVIA